MAIIEHAAILQQGSDTWNRWRSANPDILPDLTGLWLDRAHLASADLSRCRMGGSRLQDAVLSGANLRAADLTGAKLVGSDLSSADLSGANLSSVSLFQANIRDALLKGAKLYSAELRQANLAEVNFSGADLSLADLRGSKLGGARFSGADLGGAIFVDADVTGADFSGAVVWQTIFGSLDLSSALGLDRVRHRGPSVIGIETFVQSSGKIPEVFLRGCGVPEKFITYARALIGEPIEFYSCFLSYAQQDQEFASKLYSDLQARGVRCWFAPQDIKGGRKLHEQIDDAIRVADRVLLILSEGSMDSEWVKSEISEARSREGVEGKRILFPLSLVPYERIREWSAFEADTGKDSAREIREYFIPDFSHWQDPDAYSRAASRLLKDLALTADPLTRPGGGRP